MSRGSTLKRAVINNPTMDILHSQRIRGPAETKPKKIGHHARKKRPFAGFKQKENE